MSTYVERQILVKIHDTTKAMRTAEVVPTMNGDASREANNRRFAEITKDVK